MTQKSVKVWDPLVRLFHWSLVAAFFVAYLSGDDENPLHIQAGYVVLGLIAFRLVWGFVGSKHARFKDFIYSPAKVFGYLKGVRDGKPQRYLGHNPAGGYMVVALLLTLAVVTFTGLKAYGAEGHGPLAGNAQVSVVSSAHADDEWEEHEGGESEGEEFWEELHEASANFMLLLIALHVLGVVVSGQLHRENLVKAMITGKKEVD